MWIKKFHCETSKCLFTYATDSVAIRAHAAGDAPALHAFRRGEARAVLPVQSAADAVFELHQREQREDYVHMCVIIA